MGRSRPTVAHVEKDKQVVLLPAAPLPPRAVTTALCNAQWEAYFCPRGFFNSPLGAAVWRGLKTVSPSPSGTVEWMPRCRQQSSGRGISGRYHSTEEGVGRTLGRPPHRNIAGENSLRVREVLKARNACSPLNAAETDFQASNATEGSGRKNINERHHHLPNSTCPLVLQRTGWGQAFLNAELCHKRSSRAVEPAPPGQAPERCNSDTSTRRHACPPLLLSLRGARHCIHHTHLCSSFIPPLPQDRQHERKVLLAVACHPLGKAGDEEHFYWCKQELTWRLFSL